MRDGSHLARKACIDSLVHIPDCLRIRITNRKACTRSPLKFLAAMLRVAMPEKLADKNGMKVKSIRPWGDSVYYLLVVYLGEI